MSKPEFAGPLPDEQVWTLPALIRRLRMPCYRCLRQAKGGLEPGRVYFGCTDCRDRLVAASELERLSP